MPDPDAEKLRKQAEWLKWIKLDTNTIDVPQQFIDDCYRIADRLESMAKDMALLEEACEKYEAKEYARQEGGDANG